MVRRSKERESDLFYTGKGFVVVGLIRMERDGTALKWEYDAKLELVVPCEVKVVRRCDFDGWHVKYLLQPHRILSVVFFIFQFLFKSLFFWVVFSVKNLLRFLPCWQTPEGTFCCLLFYGRIVGCGKWRNGLEQW